jgi:hypothetical protein
LQGVHKLKIDKKKVDKIKGFLDEREAEYIYKLTMEASKKGPAWKSAVTAENRQYI